MATIDLKLKSHDELTFEITRLCTDNYLKQIKIDELQQRIDKAIAYIEAGKTFVNEETAKLVEHIQNDLLQILQGKDN